MPNKRLYIPASALRQELVAVEAERRELAAADGRLARRQAWIEQGIEYMSGGGTDGHVTASIREVVPPAEVFDDGGRPTVRQAIVMAMKDSAPERIWKPAEMIEELDRRGWMPEAKTAHQMIRNRMLAMVESGELVKRDPGGYYQLAGDVRNTGLLRVDPNDQ
jgi:hypothetical protein